jgi:hypothetical protein
LALPITAVGSCCRQPAPSRSASPGRPIACPCGASFCGHMAMRRILPHPREGQASAGQAAPHVPASPKHPTLQALGIPEALPGHAHLLGSIGHLPLRAPACRKVRIPSLPDHLLDGLPLAHILFPIHHPLDAQCPSIVPGWARPRNAPLAAMPGHSAPSGGRAGCPGTHCLPGIRPYLSGQRPG